MGDVGAIPVQYFSKIMSARKEREIYAALTKLVEWERHDPHRVEALFKRLDAPYYYSTTRGVRPYSPQPEPLELVQLWGHVEWWCECAFDACFINWYETGEGNIGWHRDDSPSIDSSRSIAVVSLGNPCVVKFRGEAEDELEVVGGSMYVMEAGMQSRFQHAVLGTGGARMSLVFRGMSGYVRKE